MWNDRQKQFTGLVPLEQEKFISVLKQALSAQRQRNLLLHQQQLQQQQQAQQAQQGQQTGMVGYFVVVHIESVLAYKNFHANCLSLSISFSSLTLPSLSPHPSLIPP